MAPGVGTGAGGGQYTGFTRTDCRGCGRCAHRGQGVHCDRQRSRIRAAVGSCASDSVSCCSSWGNCFGGSCPQTMAPGVGTGAGGGQYAGFTRADRDGHSSGRHRGQGIHDHLDCRGIRTAVGSCASDSVSCCSSWGNCFGGSCPQTMAPGVGTGAGGGQDTTFPFANHTHTRIQTHTW